ncbi:TyeA family type III secretion system gatekeeper subunit [Burkholderia sp. Bp8986]|uniref:TyeA family type III secretion system gatekeeper subunit n=1 Tax=Burkholderia sp. Bp8986 TaxID=2184550 RepID=UPI000F5B0868|nr:TyeA family type III secretion system gatekeeper subunit [Burkholderia sp. Bp8986]RQS44924.1 TyeA family type III secretion system gatekeeper subunit [Burkholderia sp. Bp8986]
MTINNISSSGQQPGLSDLLQKSPSLGSDTDVPEFLVQLADEEIAAQQLWAATAAVDEVASLLGELSVVRKSALKEKQAQGRKALVRAALAGTSGETEVVELAVRLSRCASELDLELLLSGMDMAGQLQALSLALDKGAQSDQTDALLEQAFERCLQQPSWAISFFSAMEFGSLAGIAAADVAALYDHAASGCPSLIEWFRKLKGIKDRSRKLKVMIHAMAAELTELRGSDERERLLDLVCSLKRLLAFLGIEEYCENVSRRAKISNMNGDALLEVVLEILEEEWFYEELVLGRYEDVGMTSLERLRYVRSLRSVMSLLPDICFRDNDQRANIMDVINSCEDRLVVAELNK